MVKINQDLSKLLKQHPFFDDMDKKSRKLLVGCAKNELYHDGDYMHREGENADKFYIIRAGTIAVELHVPGRDPMVIETLHDGEVMGWSWIVAPYKWAFDARAIGVTRVISLDAVCLRAKLDKDHALAYALFRRFVPIMGERLGAARMRLIDLYGEPRSPINTRDEATKNKASAAQAKKPSAQKNKAKKTPNKGKKA